MSNESYLDAFSSECFKLGGLRGWKYFSCYLRGREELIVTVRDFNRQQFPDQYSPIKAQLLTVVSRGHPPASPCNREPDKIRKVSEWEYVFLIATYARYGRPMVWIRSQNPKMKFGRQEVDNWQCETNFPTSDADEDLPLRLQSVESWPQRPKEVHIWQVIAELVSICVSPSPTNPFELDWTESPLKGMPTPITVDNIVQWKAEFVKNNQLDDVAKLLLGSAGMISQLQIMDCDSAMQLELQKLLYAHFELSSCYCQMKEQLLQQQQQPNLTQPQQGQPQQQPPQGQQPQQQQLPQQSTGQLPLQQQWTNVAM